MSHLIVAHGKEEKLIPLMLEGSEFPSEFSRPDVMTIFQSHYQGLEEKFEIKLHGAATGDVGKK